jgi:nucleoside-diphosphate-sugar epimerase
MRERQSPERESILITGATGFLGGLVAANALLRTHADLVLPLRDPTARDRVVDSLSKEMAAEGRAMTAADRERLVFLELPPPDRIEGLEPRLRELGVVDVLHCAGCLSYFNLRKLEEGNIELTQALTDLSVALDVRRFVFLSTAYSSGFTEAPIAESLHLAPGNDPTEYTRTKRDAEMIVAQSGLRWVIVRPSIVIGDSRDGRYAGKPYGVYQLWSAAEKFWKGVYPPVLHVVSANAPINFLHQDAFAAGFWGAYRKLPDGSVVHVVSRDENLPTMRQLWKLWMRHHGGPREVHFYDRIDQVPSQEIDEHTRLWLEFTAVNSAIASVHWHFHRENLEGLRKDGLQFVDASLDSLLGCQERFVADNPKMRRFVDEYRANGVAETGFFESASKADEL